MRRYSKCDRIRAKLTLMSALQCRLVERDAECKRLAQAERYETDPDDEEAWRLSFQRFERTRKALIRVREGMPYWRFAERRIAEIAAEGVELMPTAAARRAYGEGVRG